MSKSCPNCGAPIRFSDYLKPRLLSALKCEKCGTYLRYSGPFSFGLEIAALAISYGVYRLVEGSVTELLVLAPIGVALAFLHYRWSGLAVETRAPRPRRPGA